MKPLQNNFTTPKQSKRLLELGLPADSADCAMEDNGSIIEIIPLLDKKLFAFQKEMNRFEEENDYPHFVTYIPCWSVGRLIEIYYICAASRERIIYSGNLPFVERMVARFEEWNDAHCIDFSKLED